MRLATFNVNGIAARLAGLLQWLEEAKPDVVALQEIKCEDARFPRDAFEARGWHVETHGQKGFNGVALLSRLPLGELSRGLPGDPEDEQARFIEASIGGLRIANLYLPNGNPQPGPKFAYKLAWMQRLERHARDLLATEQAVVLLGDWNVCPTDTDVARPAEMADDALCRPESRAAFRRILVQGWTDAIRARFLNETVYTYWDYQAGAWAKNWGLRIDHLLLSPAAADRMLDAGIDRDVRARDKASDHVPVWVDLAD